jgi:hypothetical protein
MSNITERLKGKLLMHFIKKACLAIDALSTHSFNGGDLINITYKAKLKGNIPKDAMIDVDDIDWGNIETRMEDEIYNAPEDN